MPVISRSSKRFPSVFFVMSSIHGSSSTLHFDQVRRLAVDYNQAKPASVVRPRHAGIAESWNLSRVTFSLYSSTRSQGIFHSDAEGLRYADVNSIEAALLPQPRGQVFRI